MNGVYVMLVGIGGLMILMGVFFYFKMRRPFANALQAQGVVVDQEEDDSDGVTYSPIVKFTAQDGRERTFTDAVASYPALFKVGEQVQVYYNRENFDSARIGSSFRVYLGPVIVLLLGGVVLAIGLVGMR
jgi:hypothetical protein